MPQWLGYSFPLSVSTEYITIAKALNKAMVFAIKFTAEAADLSAIDTNSSFGAAYLYTDKSAASAVKFFSKTNALF